MRILLATNVLVFSVYASASFAGSQTAKAPASGGNLTYERDIRPLFVQQCVGCHSRMQVANTSISGGLALDDFAAVRVGAMGPGGPKPIVHPGKPGESELLFRLETRDAQKRMPKGGEALSPAKIDL